jgi:F-type H+-transporting ATPase subunit delta
LQDNRAARRYAQALFEVAEDNGIVSQVEADLRLLTDAITNNKDFKEFYLGPYTSRTEKFEIISNVFDGSISRLTLELVRLLLNKHRSHAMISVKDEYIALRREKSGVVYAHVTSSISLTETQQTALEAKLAKIVGKKIEADYSLDPGIIGGIKVSYNSNSIDGSILGALQNLRQQFHHDVLKQA